MNLLTISLLYFAQLYSFISPITSRERLLCIIPITQKSVDNAKVLASVYEDVCDGIRIFTHDRLLPSHILTHRVLLLIATPGINNWELRREISYKIWAYIIDRPNEFQEYDYFVKFGAADQIFVPDNFRLMLKTKNLHSQSLLHKTPLYMGQTLYNGGRPYVHGLGVYVLNAAALEIIGPLVQQLAQGNRGVLGCLKVDYKPEDDFAGFCLDDLGITPTDTRDSEGREYFLIFQARDHYEKMRIWRDDWFWHGKSRKNVARNCCAERAVSFGNYHGELLERCLRIFFARGDFTTTALHQIQVQIEG